MLVRAEIPARERQGLVGSPVSRFEVDTDHGTGGHAHKAMSRARGETELEPFLVLERIEHRFAALTLAQVNVLANLSLQATKRANIEGVRIASTHRSEGLGEAFFDLIEAFCREQGCLMMQLTTNASRDAALRFYLSRGFEASHVGLKKSL